MKFFQKILFLIFLLIFINLFLLFYTPKIDLNSISYNSNKKFIFNFNESYIKNLKNKINNSFLLYFNYCKDFDEINLFDYSCIDSFGFHSTIFESLEILYLLNLTELFNKSKLFLKNSFNCENLEYFNQKEFWNRLIGSLLGIYNLSNDIFFLNLADKCSKLILPYSNSIFINIKNKTFKNIKLFDQNNLIIGLPEILSLYKLTSNSIYLNFFKKKILNLKNFQIYNNNLSFFRTLSYIYLIYPIKKIKNILNYLINFKNFEKNFIFLEIYSLIKFKLNNLNELIDFTINYLFQNYEINFKFDSIIFRIFFKLNINHLKKFKIFKFINNLINKCEINNGISGLNNNKFNYIQNSNFFGEFSLSILFLNEKFIKITKNSIFNERGHLILFKYFE